MCIDRSRVFNMYGTEEVPADAVYIGRRGHGRDGFWGNPFPLKNPNNNAERRQCLEKYANWLRHSPAAEPQREALRRGDLRGKKLVCFCSPKLCHGHVLLKAMQEWGIE